MLELGIPIESDDRGLYTRIAVENMNKLFAKLNEMNKGKKHIIILFDEVIINHDCFDFSGLRLNYPFISIIIAVNPAGVFLTKDVEITPPSWNNILAVQLKTKHRNSYKIALLIVHINKFYNEENEDYKCLDSTNDKLLDPFTLPSGPLPIWVQRSPEITNIQILVHIKANILREASDITLVYSDETPLSSELESWLENEKWKFLDFYDIIGSETEVLVVFIENIGASMEVFTRARKQLIIVTKSVKNLISIYICRNFQSFCCRTYADVGAVVGILNKAMRHQLKDCEVCQQQFSKASSDNLETNKSEDFSPKNKLLKRCTIPVFVHHGLICHECNATPIKGNRYFCLTCPNLNLCEKCGDSKCHEHDLVLTSSKS